MHITKGMAKAMAKSAMEARCLELHRDQQTKARSLAAQFERVMMEQEQLTPDGMMYVGAVITARAATRFFVPYEGDCACGECETRIPLDDAMNMLALALDDVALEDTNSMGRA